MSIVLSLSFFSRLTLQHLRCHGDKEVAAPANSRFVPSFYHGTTCVIEHPDVSKGRDNLDFGKAFYVTQLKSQAANWAQVVYSRYEEEPPMVNTYTLDMEAIEARGYNILIFDAYDEDWLNFFVDSRMGRKPWKGYDLIEGGVANDRVIDTVEGYMNGDFTAEVAIGRLKYHKPNSQIAILNQEIIDKRLAWIEAETLKTDER